MSRDPRILIKNSSGQALVEYILLLVVILTIVGLVRQFNDSFRNYAQNYFENYLTCLIEAGELPRLGYDGDTNTVCDDEYVPFTPLQGRPLKESVRIARENALRPRSSENLRAGSSGGDRVGGSSAANERSGGNSGGRVPVSRFDPQLGSSQRSSQSSAGSASPNSSGGSGGLQYEESGPLAGQSLQNQRELRQSRVPLSSEEQTNLGRRNLNSAGVEIDSKGRVRRVPANLEPKKREPTNQDTEFTFGDFIKYLLIAIMIILMIIFFGGQAITISKSREK